MSSVERYQQRPAVAMSGASLATVTIQGEVGWHVPPGQDWCQRCGDTNYDGRTRLCLTCTYPEHPCSAVHWEVRR